MRRRVRTNGAMSAGPTDELPVEIDKPKPVHSWRELLTEIGVIEIDVSIELANEQTVEWVRWSNQVAEARGIIATEFDHNTVNTIMPAQGRGLS